MRVLVTGGTGFIGRFTVPALADAGHEVRALVRDVNRGRDILGAAVELSAGTALDERAVRTALHDCDALIQAAGVYSYDRRDASRVLRDTPALARAVLTAAFEARVPIVVDVASAIVFTTDTDRVDTSTRMAQPGDHIWHDPYVRAKVAAEQFGLDMEGRGLQRVTLHPTRVLGPRDSGPGASGASIIAFLRGGATTNAKGGWVDVRDVAAAAVASLTAAPGTHAIVSSSGLTYRQLAPLLDSLTGRRPRRTWVPARALRVMARLNDLADGRFMDLPAAPALEYILTSPPVDGSSATSLLGVTYRPIEETLTDAIRWWAANGVIPANVAGRLAE